MYDRDFCVKIDLFETEKYLERAKELGFVQALRQLPGENYIKFYHQNKKYCFYEPGSIAIRGLKTLTNEEFFGNTKMNPKGVLEVLKSFGYTHICQNDLNVFAISGEISKSAANGYYYGNYYTVKPPISCQLLTVAIEWEDKENKIYPPLPKPTFVEVKLNDDYTAKVYKDKVEVGCQTFPITILDKLNEAVRKYDL